MLIILAKTELSVDKFLKKTYDSDLSFIALVSDKECLLETDQFDMFIFPSASVWIEFLYRDKFSAKKKSHSKYSSWKPRNLTLNQSYFDEDSTVKHVNLPGYERLYCERVILGTRKPSKFFNLRKMFSCWAENTANRYRALLEFMSRTGKNVIGRLRNSRLST